MAGTLAQINIAPATATVVGDRGFAVVLIFNDGTNQESVEIYLTNKMDLSTTVTDVLANTSDYDPFP